MDGVARLDLPNNFSPSPPNRSNGLFLLLLRLSLSSLPLSSLLLLVELGGGDGEDGSLEKELFEVLPFKGGGDEPGMNAKDGILETALSNSPLLAVADDVMLGVPFNGKGADFITDLFIGTLEGVVVVDGVSDCFGNDDIVKDDDDFFVPPPPLILLPLPMFDEGDLLLLKGGEAVPNCCCCCCCCGSVEN